MWFSENSPLVLKMLKKPQKNTRAFQWKEDVNVVAIITLSSTKSCCVYRRETAEDDNTKVNVYFLALQI